MYLLVIMYLLNNTYYSLFIGRCLDRRCDQVCLKTSAENLKPINFIDSYYLIYYQLIFHKLDYPLSSLLG
jgi:hypothetical protein